MSSFASGHSSGTPKDSLAKALPIPIPNLVKCCLFLQIKNQILSKSQHCHLTESIKYDINILKPLQNGQHFADIFKWIFFQENW